ncbi:hypothetical protein AAL_06080 [Moelleriella libera RCEF 2490]|uniref:Microbial-type PARG catalytic domain-containing protein n=1 Tax=Moelleriella libera RCEF 2490 TaxID=1081109 RepID=A0A167ZBV4_9HYPO|nr:hypothetical protein AAL_06080 [Moelleriella libera RCEF 2490]
MPIPPRIARARRDKRAKKARAFINKTLPAILRSNARAKAGAQAAMLMVDPPPASPPPETTSKPTTTSNLISSSYDGACEGESGTTSTPLVDISIYAGDTLAAASKFHFCSSSSSGSSESSISGDNQQRFPKPPEAPAARVAVLNMASPLRPGGGVLTGATSQEEALCSRTTLYASLREDFYRLPDVGGVYTPDVLVVRDAQSEDLRRDQRFFVDVITSAMLRMPDVQDATYAEEQDREMVLRKMKAVLRMARSQCVTRLVLGAWGCGGYGNPPGDVARAWKRVLCGGTGRGRNQDSSDSSRRGGQGQTRHGNQKNRRRNCYHGEGWEGLQVVFAIREQRLARIFADTFGTEILIDADGNEEEEEGATQLPTDKSDCEEQESEGSDDSWTS